MEHAGAGAGNSSDRGHAAPHLHLALHQQPFEAPRQLLDVHAGGCSRRDPQPAPRRERRRRGERGGRGREKSLPLRPTRGCGGWGVFVGCVGGRVADGRGWMAGGSVGDWAINGYWVPVRAVARWPLLVLQWNGLLDCKCHAADLLLVLLMLLLLLLLLLLSLVVLMQLSLVSLLLVVQSCLLLLLLLLLLFCCCGLQTVSSRRVSHHAAGSGQEEVPVMRVVHSRHRLEGGQCGCCPLFA